MKVIKEKGDEKLPFFGFRVTGTMSAAQRGR